MMEFYDAVTPANIPGSDKEPPVTSACLYYDGAYAARPVEARWFRQVRWITVLGDYEHCGIADWERGNAVFSQPGKIEDWVNGRLAMGKRARVNCNRSSLPVLQGRLAGLDWLLWLSTLDGTIVRADAYPNLWAVQFAGGPTAPFDTSILYGEW
jgi:hypothetical protein